MNKSPNKATLENASNTKTNDDLNEKLMKINWL